ncbi:disulfide bond formation protein B [Streptomyces solincola]|nr:disulfide bond formation protein B [Streptomyces solincola]
MTTTTTTTAPAATLGRRPLGNYVMLLIPLAYCGILAASLAVQFSGELPCELCLMQRWCMLLVSVGPVYVVQRIRLGRLTPHDVSRGLGVTVVASMLGGLISLHQLTLTNLPGHHGFGPVILGLHTYTWALVCFTLTVLYAAVHLMWPARLAPQNTRAAGAPERLVVGLYVCTTLLVCGLAVLQGGFHLDFHTFRYELPHDLGLL